MTTGCALTDSSTTTRSPTPCHVWPSVTGVRLTEVSPADESLESVFAYLVAR